LTFSDEIWLVDDVPREKLGMLDDTVFPVETVLWLPLGLPLGLPLLELVPALSSNSELLRVLYDFILGIDTAEGEGLSFIIGLAPRTLSFTACG
jgi:hypothetical protein